MKIVYSGSQRSIEVPSLRLVAERGVPVEVYDGPITRSLLKRKDFSEVKESRVKAPKRATESQEAEPEADGGQNGEEE